MVEIVFVFCLLASPAQCQEQHSLSEPLSLMECVVEGQQLAQNWLAEHPKWLLARWRCEGQQHEDEPA